MALLPLNILALRTGWAIVIVKVVGARRPRPLPVFWGFPMASGVGQEMSQELTNPPKALRVRFVEPAGRLWRIKPLPCRMKSTFMPLC